MKALVLTEYNKFEYLDVPTPVPGEGEVLIKVKACAVCGSDVHGMDGSSGRRQPPDIMGHEASGQIEALGPGVEGWSVGDRVTFDSTVYCNRCDACRAGNVNLCTNRQVLGVSCDDYRRDGAFADYLVVPAYICYKLPDTVSYLQAAMVEPLAIAYHAATRTPITSGMSAVIVGVGTIGLLTLQVAKAMGAGPIIAVDIDEAKLATALDNGADVAVNSAEPDALDRILAATDGTQGADIALDATGIDATTHLCLKSVKLNGSVVLIGNIVQQINFPLQWVVTRQLSLFGTCASAGEYDECLKLIADREVDVEALISKVVPLTDGHEWITRVYNREPGLNKIVLLPEG
ncbi:galactitol-1-phosphate 5-dehydrogenase [Propionimicrobium sp. PCR01-08-3]|uniref:zinc-dependent alcohol dehydrogenase n=1 Tax=Propionimicrobium sp. PCR01-08-3 TaxID=3052086 RepID=UPI00255C9FA4|nr:galactitol-1-phosphate 5-dehydrogenase [Propionimicrobium sp. PCR01-08-3]WIY83462.1 galactitol-1-phosphate 5-dehydrogenase [Propionimicrobium sp. PCR01-08-3]